MLRKLSFDLWYVSRPPWDTGVSPPELVEVIEGSPRRERLAPGRALDLGCGTGTNVLYLARHGWQATGVDFAARAIRKARRKARTAGAQVDLRVGDVTDLRGVAGQFDLALDIGCFHTLDAPGHSKYAASLARLLRPGALYLLYAFKPGDVGPPGVAEPEVQAAFAGPFRLVEIQQGQGRPSAWYTFERTAE